ncbi:cyclically-permuted mutarotase family protein [Shewanella sp. YLB-09]|nr:cyclically-permuted mutarotase family protein [Shewanella sp. YLB-09]
MTFKLNPTLDNAVYSHKNKDIPLKYLKMCILFSLCLSLYLNAVEKPTTLGDSSERFNNSNKQASAEIQILWKKSGSLPAPEGFLESLGVSAAYTAFLGDYLIVAGGANFPKGHPVFQNGQKEYYSDIFVFDVSNDQLKLVSNGHLPIKSGYGATVVVGNSLYLVGGQNNEQALDSIIKLTLDDNQVPITEVIAKLPFTWALGSAAWQNNALYLFAGQQNTKPTNKVCRFSFEKGTCINAEDTPAIPGVNRVQFPSINHNGLFYIFGGMNFEGEKDEYVLTDSYAFDFKSKSWQVLSPTTLDGKAFAVTGGGVASLSSNKLLLLGGVNKKIFDHAIYQLGSLQNEELNEFKQAYFAMEPKDFHFSHRQVIYNIKENSWDVSSDDVPFPGGAGPLNIEQKENKVFWISGEVKPVIRSPIVYQGTVSIMNN